MKRNVLYVFLLCFGGIHEHSMLGSAVKKTCSKSCSISKNTWLPRSFSSYSMHDILQEKFLWNPKDDHKDQKLQVSMITQYDQNFGGICSKSCKNLGSMPFWSGTNQLTVGNNDGRALLDGYQLGIGDLQVDKDGIAGTIELNPTVQQFGADLMLYYVREKEDPGIYFKLHLPLAAMIMRHGFKETKRVIAKGLDSRTQTTTAGTRVSTSTPPPPVGTIVPNPSADITYYAWRYPIVDDNGHDSISTAFFGGTYNENSLNGNFWKPWRLRKGRIEPRKQTQIRMADISAVLGYNFIVNEDGFFGAGFKFSCPTGNVPTADYMLEPIVGRAGLWAIGIEAMGKYRIWENALDTDSIDIWMQGEVLHLMSGRRPNFRSFDLKRNGPGSKYLLVQHYASEYQHLAVTPFTTSVKMTPQGLHSALEITTLPVFSKFMVEGSCALMFDYNHKAWNVALGAEVWGRSQEELSIDVSSGVNQRHPNLNAYAVLGRQIDGYLIDGQSSEVKSYYCEPYATINKSLDPVVLVGTPPFVVRPQAVPTGIKDARLSANRIPEKFSDALDIEGAQASSVVTGKLFGQVGYTWQECFYMPTIAIIGAAEFVNNTNNAIEFWSIGLQGTLNF